MARENRTLFKFPKMSLEKRIRIAIKDVPDFPKEGIIFKDIMPLFLNADLSQEVLNGFVEYARKLEIDCVCGIESRGFFFGPSIARELNVPFIPLRKQGKLPGLTDSMSYDLEYGQATIEVQKDVFSKNAKVLLHDDLLATGGTAMAAINLLNRLELNVSGICFIVELDFLNGRDKLKEYCPMIQSLVRYS